MPPHTQPHRASADFRIASVFLEVEIQLSHRSVRALNKMCTAATRGYTYSFSNFAKLDWRDHLEMEKRRIRPSLGLRRVRKVFEIGFH
jgi:hypothetical protein